ncbi:UNVERIFIED_CONTAM: AEC family transporter [Clostridioides difficile]|uniref:AEC family transporter n=1 Tax=Clostridioides difficile TaxID=1496 RepID=UPI0008260716|nr:AEC family transporter [Clostridioides difficile]MDO0136278.1 AEC family transporter [Clostridioides difficile]MDX5649345.1 AEC family transporter [Clostridioides difficile]HBG7259461.1 AEC family transporter [Clostridioides difficile]HBY2627059.1 AEC family transporter [Clostridioides difficile]HBY3615733.1 AEC family transporter [Clostridioides difficile]
MELAIITLEKVMIMCILALTGLICYKRGIIDEEQNKGLSELVLQVFTPILLFTSLQQEFSAERIKGFIICVIVSVIGFLISLIIAQIASFREDRYNKPVELVALIYSNCGFIGIPLVQGIFGSEGVFYMSAFVAVSNFLIWTHAVLVMSGKADLKSILSSFKSPTIISIIAGMIFFVMQWRLPEFIMDPLEMFAAINTPLAMMVAGINIAQENIVKLLSHGRLYFMCLLRLIVIPFALLIFLKFISIDRAICQVAILATACPTGVTGTLFAMRYNKNSGYATEIFAMTTILSIWTLPFIIIFC